MKTKTTAMIEAPDTEELEIEQTSIVQKASALAVTSQPEHAHALILLKQVATAERQVKDLFEKPKADAFAAHKSITAAEKKLLEPLGEARRIITQKANLYEETMRRLVEEETRRLQEEARKAEEERQIQDAILAEHAGDKAAAEQILATPIETPTVTVAPKLAEVAGISSRLNYKAEVTDLLALVMYVAANPHELALLQVNPTALNGRAKSMRDGFKLPGCKLIKETVKAVKAG